MILASPALAITGGSTAEFEIEVPRLFKPTTIAFYERPLPSVARLRGVLRPNKFAAYLTVFRYGARESLIALPGEASYGCDAASFEKLFAQIEHPTLEAGELIRASVFNASTCAVMFSFNILGFNK